MTNIQLYDDNFIPLLYVGDRLAAQQIKDALIYDGEIIHKRAGGALRRKHKPVNELKDAWGIRIVQA